jgi:hypothetical protein
MSDANRHNHSETTGEVVVSPDMLKSLASSLVDDNPNLAGLAEPIDLEQVKYRIFKSVLRPLSYLADRLGYGWVAGINAVSDRNTGKGINLGEDYIWIDSGQKGGRGDWYEFTGPGFSPNYTRQDGVKRDEDQYKFWDRTSFEFVDVGLVYQDTEYSNPRWLDLKDTTLYDYDVDNTASGNPVTTNFSLEYFKQGQVGATSQRTWSSNFSWSASSTISYNSGGEGMMFPSVSVSLTTTAGGNESSGSSRSSNNISTLLTSGEHGNINITHATPAYTRGKYGVMGQSGTAVLDFQGKATLVFGVKIHGFLRWGGEGTERFRYPTNFHNDYTKSGDRPTFEFTLGGKKPDGSIEPFWVALARAVNTNAAPWNWTAMINDGGRSIVDGLIKDSARMCSFPIKGVMAGIQRNNVRWVVIQEEAVSGPALGEVENPSG